MENRQALILNYLEGYNKFDITKMVKDFSDDIVFKNIQNEETSMVLTGIEEFKVQAESAKSYFTERKQKVVSFKHDGQNTEIEVEYFAVLAIDFPNGMKKGQEIKLTGRSIFEFKDDKIVSLTDIS
jgi:hypothetical protein